MIAIIAPAAAAADAADALRRLLLQPPIACTKSRSNGCLECHGGDCRHWLRPTGSRIPINRLPVSINQIILLLLLLCCADGSCS
jgi:hypothetical protein